MEVSVTIQLSVLPREKHAEQMRSVARSLTNDAGSVQVTCPAASPKQICARFTVPEAREGDVGGRIGRQFWQVENYQDSSIGFLRLVIRDRQTSGSSCAKSVFDAPGAGGENSRLVIARHRDHALRRVLMSVCDQDPVIETVGMAL